MLLQLLIFFFMGILFGIFTGKYYVSQSR